MTPEEQRVEQFLARACELARAGDAAALTEAFRGPLAWNDRQRGHEAVRRLCQLVLDIGPTLPGSDWIEVYAAAANGLVDSLEREPAEPVLLNAAGVFLHELTQYDAAIAIFEIALALDPALPSAESNLAAALDLRGDQALLGRPEDRELARRLCEAAAAADLATGLTVSLCMIVKDEEEMLAGCLEAVASSVDELIIVDTGSTDRTVEIAESFGAKVINFPWNGSFSDARNVGLNAATGDWILYLDADERLVDGDAEELRSLLGRTWREGFFLEVRNLTGAGSTEVVHPALRLFRNRPEYRFEGRIHEEASGAMPTFLPERFEPTSVRLFHLGYVDQLVEKRQKSARNLELLELENDTTPGPYASFNLGSEYQRLGRWLIAGQHFDEAWEGVRHDEWLSIGFAPLLALRTARARRECGRVEEAREILNCALEQLPEYTDLVFELALCAIEVDDRDEAERLLERCLELGDAPAGLASTIGAGSHLARERLADLRHQANLTPSR